jgi:hypothetical protein
MSNQTISDAVAIYTKHFVLPWRPVVPVGSRTLQNIPYTNRNVTHGAVERKKNPQKMAIRQ